MDRPATSRPRGTCSYYNTPRGCFAGDKCKFQHGESDSLTPFDRAKRCKFYANGYCRKGDKCWFVHTPKEEQTIDEEEENICCICLEKPTTYGLLAGCSHVFCLQCIRQWRDPENKSGEVVSSGVTKRCPLCRSASRFVTPSSHYFTQDDPKKQTAVEGYKASMARTPCRYFAQSKPSGRFCPFGKDCFYKHVNDDGSPHISPHGVEHNMRIFHARRSRRIAGDTLAYTRMLDEFGATVEAIRASLAESQLENGRGRDARDETNDSSTFDVLDEPTPDELSVAEFERESDTLQTLDRLAGQMLATLTAYRNEEEVMIDDEGLSTLSRLLQESMSLNHQIPDTNEEESIQSGGTGGGDTSTGEMDESHPPTDAIPTTSQSSLPLSPFAPEFIPSSERGSSTPGTSRAAFIEVLGAPSDSNDTSAEPPEDVGVVEDHSAALMLAMPGAMYDWRTEDSRSQDEAQSTTSFDPSQILSSTSRLDQLVLGDDPVLEGESDMEVYAELVDEETKIPENEEEPPNVTDGRGRAVWSGGRGCALGVRGPGRVGSCTKRNVVEGESAVDGVGFMTDGRGRVIGTSEEDV